MKILWQPTLGFSDPYTLDPQNIKGGTQLIDYQTVMALNDYGVETHLQTDTLNPIVPESIITHPTNGRRLTKTGKTFCNHKELLNRIVELDKIHNYDYIILNNYTLSRLTLALPTETLKKVRCFIQSYLSRGWATVNLMKVFLGLPNQLITHSSFMAQAVNNIISSTPVLGEVKPLPIKVLRTPTYVRDYRLNPVVEDNGRYVCICNWHKKLGKSPIPAARFAKAHGVPVDIYTSERFMEDTELVRVFVKTPHKELMEKLRYYRALLHFFPNEAFGLCMLEAASFGLPVLTASPSVESIIPSGYYFLGKREELTLQALSSLPEKSLDLASQMKDRFNPEEMAKAWVSILGDG